MLSKLYTILTLCIIPFYNNDTVSKTNLIKIFLLVSLLILAILVAFGVVFWPRLMPNKPGPAKIPPFEPANLTWEMVATSSPWEARDSHEVYEFAGKLWLTSGLNANSTPGAGTVNVNYEKAKYFNDIWSTADGVNWTLETEHADFPPIRSQSIIYFKGALYMFGGWSPKTGYNNGIWRLTDGKSWTKMIKKPAYEEREGQKITVWNNRLWLMGGVNYFKDKTFNDIWVSDDAQTWTKVTDQAPWPSRWDHAIAIYDNKLWLAGGMSDIKTGYNDVWQTADGINWIESASSTPWGAKQGGGLIAYKNYLWFIGGLDTAENTGDGITWFSNDGLNWQQASTTTPALAREDHGVILWQDKIWVLGGMTADWRWQNDIWVSK